MNIEHFNENAIIWLHETHALSKIGITIEIERCILHTAYSRSNSTLMWSNFSVNSRYIENETKLNWKWYGTMTIDQPYCSDTWHSDRTLNFLDFEKISFDTLARNMKCVRVFHHCSNKTHIFQIHSHRLIYDKWIQTQCPVSSVEYTYVWWVNIFISLYLRNDFNISYHQPWPCFLALGNHALVK